MSLRVLTAVSGGLLVLVLWLLLVPWDLSEVNEQGQLVSGGSDDNVVKIALVLAVAVVVAVGLLFAARGRYPAGVFLSGASAVWVVLFAWRSAVARTEGANMFVVPLLFVVLPLAVALPLLVRVFERKLSRGAS